MGTRLLLQHNIKSYCAVYAGARPLPQHDIYIIVVFTEVRSFYCNITFSSTVVCTVTRPLLHRNLSSNCGLQRGKAFSQHNKYSNCSLYQNQASAARYHTQQLRLILELGFCCKIPYTATVVYAWAMPLLQHTYTSKFTVYIYSGFKGLPAQQYAI